VRFVDPYADVEPWSFTLRAGEPGAEIEIAARVGAWEGTPLHFVAHSDRPGVQIVISDWAEKRLIRLADHAGGSGGPFAFDASRAWRRHTFWWNAEERYAVRTIRFAACSTDGEPATVRLRYLGRSAPPATGFERDLVRLSLRGAIVAGGESEVDVAIANRGSFAWATESTLPVQFGLKMRSLDDSTAPVVEARRPLARSVKPGESIAQTFTVQWPERPGRYEVTLDLVLEDVAWFEARVGEPLARTEVEVAPR
jgi:hypothetical protein